jgi:uncharacterized membrane protein
MKPLLILLLTFGLVLAGASIFRPAAGFVDNFMLAGPVAMSVMLVFTAVGHFAFRAGMELMLPTWLPAKSFWVWASGVFELAAAVRLHIPDWQVQTVEALLIFFVVSLPLNILAARKHLDYQRGTFDGPGLRYLWFRVPLQLFFMAWAMYFSVFLPIYNMVGEPKLW